MIFVCVRSHLAQAWYPAGKLIYIFHFEIRSRLVGDCKKVKNGVGRSAHGNVKRHCIHEGLTCCDTPWKDAFISFLIVFICIGNNLACCPAEKVFPAFVGCENRSVSRKGKSDCLSEAVHGIGREHSRAASASRTRAILYL